MNFRYFFQQLDRACLSAKKGKPFRKELIEQTVHLKKEFGTKFD